MFAVALLATTGAVGTAFAGPAAQQSNTGIYDGPNFVAPLSDTY
jgi:hypothetical protein